MVMARRTIEGEPHPCLFLGCDRPGVTELRLHLRRLAGKEPRDAWTHDTGAYLCDEHSRQGLAIEVAVAPNQDPALIFTAVQAEPGDAVEMERELRLEPPAEEAQP